MAAKSVGPSLTFIMLVDIVLVLVLVNVFIVVIGCGMQLGLLSMLSLLCFFLAVHMKSIRLPRVCFFGTLLVAVFLAVLTVVFVILVGFSCRAIILVFAVGLCSISFGHVVSRCFPTRV